jgi:hypothetical protein
MALQQDLEERMRAAMKAGDKATLSTMRMVVAAVTTKSKESGAALSDADALSVLAKLAKMRKESIGMFEAGGKMEAAAKEREELKIIEAYLPTLAGEAVVKGWIDEAIVAACGDEPPDKTKMGAVMSKLMMMHKGEFDAKEASRWVTEALR